MSILLTSVDVRQERRLRLFFTHALASGAFGAPAPGYYVITSVDGIATPPDIQAAYVVPGSPNVVELSFDAPLVRGALYNISAIAVPATDVTVTSAAAHIDFRWGLLAPKQNVETEFQNRELLLYGTDLVWNGSDYQESATDDLDRVEGTANVSKALNRGIETSPGDYPWDTTYGAGARAFVDSPSLAVGTLKGAAAAQILRDPRVNSVKMTYEIEDEKTFLYADPRLISGQPIERVSIEVPNDT